MMRLCVALPAILTAVVITIPFIFTILRIFLRCIRRKTHFLPLEFRHLLCICCLLWLDDMHVQFFPASHYVRLFLLAGLASAMILLPPGLIASA